MKTPDNDRLVLTWAKNGTGWIIDSWDGKKWFKASAWGYKVVYWEELPAEPKLKG